MKEDTYWLKTFIRLNEDKSIESIVKSKIFSLPKPKKVQERYEILSATGIKVIGE